MNEIKLSGCRPEPLAHYLKALGVLRLVSEQKDREARGWWEEDTFWLRTKINLEELQTFFLGEYQPTPIVAPWNGGSGFYPKDKKEGIDAIRSSNTGRLTNYKMTIEAAEQLITSLGLTEKSSGGDKQALLRACRNHFPEEGVAWLDAAYVLTEDEAKYPPLLGTGGNDGRLEFTNNFMQRLIDLIDPETGQPKPSGKAWLSAALFGEATPGLLSDKPIGQFHPGAAGGANATTGFSSKPLINPWDFVLMLEGALVFAAAATKRLRNSGMGELSYPFTTRASGVGYASAASADENPRGEIWVPLWSTPSCLSEVATLFSEGRAQVGRRPATSGVDFARALATLGTDRGIKVFNRYGFQVRNGLAYFATSLGRWNVTPHPEANLLDELDQYDWLSRLRRAATGSNAPARIGRALRTLEEAIILVCQKGGAQMANLLIALGETEASLAGSPNFRNSTYIRPVPLLSPAWLEASDDASPEFHLAAALASMSRIRQNMEPVQVDSEKAQWDIDDHPRVVWGSGSLVDNMIAVLTRRCMDAQKEQQELPLKGKYFASLEGISRFISGDVDDERITKLLWGLSLIDWSTASPQRRSDTESDSVSALYALLKLTHLPGPLREVSIPFNAAILARASAGNAPEASRLAATRLKGSGFVPKADTILEPKPICRRTAAALLFPISNADTDRLAKRILNITNSCYAQEFG